MKKLFLLIVFALLASNCFAGPIGPSFFDLDEVISAYDAEVAASAGLKLDNLGLKDYARMPAGPVAHWSAKGLTTAGIAVASGVRDLSGFGFNGDQVNGVTVATTSMGSAFAFVRTSTQRVNIYDVPVTATMTLACWINTADVTPAENRYFMSKANATAKTGTRIAVSDSPAGRIFVGFGNSTTFLTLTSASTVVANTWTHVVVSVAGTDARIYIDGRLDASATLASVPVANSAAVSLGRGGEELTYAGNFYSGQIADPRIYDRALSAAEVKALYMAGADSGPVYMRTDGSNAADPVTFPTLNVTGEIDGIDAIERIQRSGILHPSATRWGIKIAKTNSDPLARVEYIYDAVGFAPAQMNLTTNVMDYGGWEAFCNLYNRPVMLTYAGTVDYELASSSQLLKAAGGASNATDTAYAGNAMSEFKLLWLATFEDATHYYIIFSDAQYSRDYNAYAFTDENGVIRDVMYYGMYEGMYDGTRLRSMATGTAMASQAGQVEITRALANNSATPTDPDGWYINYWSQRNFVMYLSWLISKSTDSQAAFGNGNSNSGAHVDPGSLIAQPRFWGSSATDAGVKLFYIENFWGNYWQRCAGLLFNSNSKIMSRGYGPYNETGEGYAINPISPTGSGNGSLITGYVGDYGFIPLVSDGSASQYFNSGFWYFTPAINTTMFALVGGHCGFSSQCGASAVRLDESMSYSLSSIGASISFLKVNK